MGIIGHKKHEHVKYQRSPTKKDNAVLMDLMCDDDKIFCVKNSRG